jgi:hypothetical protein
MIFPVQRHPAENTVLVTGMPEALNRAIQLGKT